MLNIYNTTIQFLWATHREIGALHPQMSRFIILVKKKILKNSWILLSVFLMLNFKILKLGSRCAEYLQYNNTIFMGHS